MNSSSSNPADHYVSLDVLLPGGEKDGTLAQVEVCLGNGILASDKETFASLEKAPRDFDWKALHANWNIQSAHHDMILPARKKSSKEQVKWAISARNGRHKTERELLATKQHLLNKLKNTKKKPNEKSEEIPVAGLIQAVTHYCS